MFHLKKNKQNKFIKNKKFKLLNLVYKKKI